MRKIAVLCIFISLLSLNAKAKTIDLDFYLKQFYLNGDYEKCIGLSRVVQVGKLYPWRLPQYGIKYSENNEYVSDSSYFWEYQSLRYADPSAFFYRYIINKEEFLKYFCTEDLRGFDKWVYDEYNEKIPLDKWNEEYEIGERELLKRFKLIEIYKFLEVQDTLLLKRVFHNDTLKEDFYNKIKGLKIADLNSKGVSEIYPILKGVISKYRILHPSQINNILLQKGFNKIEKMAIAFCYVSNFIKYDAVSGNTSCSDVESIIKYSASICQGYSMALHYFLSVNDIECYTVTLKCKKTYIGIQEHANNIVVFNNDVYYVDATWGIYYTSFKTESTLLDKIGNIEKKISDFSYIEEIQDGNTYKHIDEFKKYINIPKKKK